MDCLIGELCPVPPYCRTWLLWLKVCLLIDDVRSCSPRWGGGGNVVCHPVASYRLEECRSDSFEEFCKNIRKFFLGLRDGCYVATACENVSKDTETYVLFSISRLPCKSTSSKFARRKSDNGLMDIGNGECPCVSLWVDVEGKGAATACPDCRSVGVC